MAGDTSSDTPASGSSTSSTGTAGSDQRSDWRCCEPPHCCEPRHHWGHPYWDPYCGPPRDYGRHHHYRGRHHPWPIAGGEFFETMMNFAAAAAGSRGRWWQGMADAARYSRKDYSCYDPCYDPCSPNPSYCDPCPPPWSYCDPCEPPPCPPPRSCCDPCDPCEPQHGRHGLREEPDQINLKHLRETLDKATAEQLKSLEDRIDEAREAKQVDRVNELTREHARAKSKADAATDAVIHDVKLARVTEAMRRKQWSRGSGYQRRY
jgi:hypothetical protein